MEKHQRWEARIALAMLPVGASLTLTALLGAVAAALLILDTLVHRPEAAGWLLAWCVAALVVAVYNLIRSIEVMSAFDWRPVPTILLLSLAITLAYPGWWL